MLIRTQSQLSPGAQSFIRTARRLGATIARLVQGAFTAKMSIPIVVTKVRKWGNSQGLRLSKQVLDLADIAVGDDVQIVVGDGQIMVKKAGSKYDLAELVA